MKSEEKPIHETTIIHISGSLYMRIPPILRDYMKINPNSDMKIQTEHGQHGKYASFWNNDEQK